ncbi:50S ribosomal protein L11 [Candidatus Kaiserbacteria bacterium RIFCSPHIGHO2_01_FULL_50_13]|uniref:Large ribosomal subunit protein uL11 n=1 Tax=Candidatus Kaiserbacteria bacterium RIFCSPLOWO2_01_FULL_50_24 TaxID=1798507 RepID=A0A1F6ERK0_9BACT|nr:MAG: 50S ribosomal protein L11 [Candidatus Kaiserbacteria bacterium RIFCSPHIGHO2_01_FULL_50_13]OGG76082.1 MAG: 50S ribosomal protein L11 [Candidatus Kaiserbacteria bacterium RIFCSPLOWO2_01_FULL_50_24]OGG81709.1 MAG: 50S ribosomal protein L11 [Candidatus Kaiserbacteria bacterium RIFCSPLOWO2_02_FULL_51_13]
MAKEITKIIKLQIAAGAATPAPPVGTALGPAGVNIGEFVKQFNDQTRPMAGNIVPVLMTVYKDRSFTFIVKKPPASRLILKKLGLEKGSDKPQNKVGKLTKQQLQEIAEDKMEDMNAGDISQAKKVIAGTARSMGIDAE